jgi:hypothetical protein
LRATRVVRIEPSRSVVVANVDIVTIGVTVAIAITRSHSVVVGPPKIVAIGVTRRIMIAVAIIVAVKPPWSVMINVPAIAAVGHAVAVMIRPRQCIMPVGVQVMPRPAQHTAKVVGVGIAVGPHLVNDLTEPHPRLFQRRDLIEAQGHPAVTSHLRCSERSGN